MHRHDVHMVALTIPNASAKQSRHYYAECESGSKGCLHHKRAGQRKGNVIE